MLLFSNAVLGESIIATPARFSKRNAKSINVVAAEDVGVSSFAVNVFAASRKDIANFAKVLSHPHR